ncbi:MAG: hypothetical protein NC218_01655 [Acetobacter sp.]|nr:hypothetical protein [Acetobacter sp.]
MRGNKCSQFGAVECDAFSSISATVSLSLTAKNITSDSLTVGGVCIKIQGSK